MKPTNELQPIGGATERKTRLASCVLALSLMLPLLSHAAQGERYTDAYGRITPSITKSLTDPTGGIIDEIGSVICKSIPGTVYKDNKCQCESGEWSDTAFACVGGSDSGGTTGESDPATAQEHCEQVKDKGWKWDSEKGKCVDSNGNEVVECDNAEGGVGDEIKKSIDLHTEMASVSPVLGSIFEANQECFAGVLNVFDLSFAIPSPLDLITSALNAVKMYAKRAICKALNKITNYINAPIALAIQNVINNSNGAIANMSASLGGDFLRSLYSGKKGYDYHEQTPSGYTYVNTNPLGLVPRQYVDNTEDIARAAAETQKKVNEIQSRKANAELELQSAESALAAAERSLQLCQTRSAVSAGLTVGASSSGSNCSAEENAVAAAEAQVNTIAAELADLENQMTAAINIPLPEIKTTPIPNAYVTADQFAAECDGKVVIKGSSITCLTNTPVTTKAYTIPTAPTVTKAATKQTEPPQGTKSQTQKKSGASDLIRSLGGLL